MNAINHPYPILHTGLPKMSVIEKIDVAQNPKEPFIGGIAGAREIMHSLKQLYRLRLPDWM